MTVMLRSFFNYKLGTGAPMHLRIKIALVVVAILLTATVNVEGRDGSKDWIVLNDCRLIPNPANDGDSSFT